MDEKFPIGKLVATTAVNENITDNEQFAQDTVNAMVKFRHCDWGVTCEEDKHSNDKAVASGDDRILAVYETCKGQIWIITEWDRSCTTILFPSEY